MTKKRQLFLHTVEQFREMIKSQVFHELAKRSEKDFTRKRKMSLANYIWFLLSSTKRSLASALNAFVEELNVSFDNYSKQAFSQGRLRIRPEALLVLMQAVRDWFYEDAEYETWRGMRVMAIDGTTYNLPTSEELKERFGIQKSSGNQIQAQGSCLYDVLNGIILDAQLTDVKGAERTLAQQHLDALAKNPARRGEKELLLLDRGYPSGKMIDALEEKHFFYVMRCEPGFCKGMKLGNYKGEDDRILDHKFKNAEKSRHFRVIRFRMSEDTEETLLTNLTDASLTCADFRELYHRRWAVETKYDDLKNKVEIENFSGQSELAVMQDFYAAMTIANLVSVLIFDNREKITEYNRNEDRAYQYKQNFNVTLGLLREKLLRLLTEDSPRVRARMVNKLKADAARHLIPIRNGRSRPRERAHQSFKFPPNSRRA